MFENFFSSLRRENVIFCLSYTLVFLHFTASPIALHSQSLTLKDYNIEDGLAQSVVYDILADSKGFIWFATQDGISKFDGKYFENYSATDGVITSLVRSLMEDYNGNIWLGTDRGISIFKNNKIESHAEMDGISLISVRNMKMAPDSTIWLASVGSGLLSYKNGKMRQYSQKDGLVSNLVYAISIDKNGQVWIGTDNGISVFNGKSFETIDLSKLDFLPRMRTIAVNDNGEVWAGGYGYGLIKIVGRKATLVREDYNFPKARVNRIYFNQRGDLWAGMDGNGVFLRRGNTSSFFNKKEGFTNNSILSIENDNQGNLWFGTYGGGVFKLSRSNIVTYTTSHGLSGQNVTSLVYNEQSKEIWVGTNNNGLNRITSDGTISTYSTSNSPLLANRIHGMLMAVNGELYIGHDGGYTVFSKGTFKPISLSKKINNISIRCFLYNPLSDELWAGTFGQGLIRIRKGKIDRFTRENHGLANDSVFAIVNDKKGNIWFGTDGGISTWNNGDIRTIYGVGELKFDRVSSLSTNPNGNLWIGTLGNGLFSYNPENNEAQQWTMDNGLSSNIVTFAITDASGVHWIGTKKGFSIFDGENIRYLNTKNGLYSNETSQRTGLLTTNNQLMFGSVSGFSVVDLNDPLTISDNIPLYINSIKVMDRDTMLVSNLTLPHYQNFLAFRFIGIDFSNPEGVKYRYRLIGLEENWRFTDQNTVQYTSLPPGKYTFEVNAKNESDVWSNSTAKYSFEIQPPFYRTPLFIGLGWFTLVGLALAWVRLRENQLKQYNRELETEVERRTTELKESQEVFRLISENAADFIAVFDENEKTEYCSPSVKSLLGYEVDDFLSRNPYSVIHPNDRSTVKKVFLETRRTGTPKVTRYRIANSSGEYRFFEGSVNVVGHRSRKNRTVAVSHDITDQVTFEEELKNSKEVAEQANKAKSMFLASMSHELRTPLNSIIGFSQILERSPDIPEKFSNYISIMHRSGEHLLTMINDILDLSKIEAGNVELHPTEFLLRGMIDDLKNMFQIQSQDKNLDFNVSVDENVPPSYFQDSSKLNQVLINLLSNAFKFTDSGSVSLHLSYNKASNKLIFSVKDTGRGIPDKQKEDIFKPFQQVIGQFSKGTGLGLTISRSLINMMGGEISVTSKVNEGSTFKIKMSYVTTRKEIVGESDIPVAYERISGIKSDKKLTVLVVDDISENRDLLVAFLAPIGFSILEASDGKEAIEMAEKHTPDLILMDIVMPILGGKEAMIQLRKSKKFAKTPIFAVTASGLFNEAEMMIEAGFTAYIRKPFKESELFSAISEYLHVEFTYASVKKDQSKAQIQNADLQNAVILIEELDEAIKLELISAIELNEVNEIYNLCTKNTIPKELSSLLKGHLDKKDYRFFISLNDIINPE